METKLLPVYDGSPRGEDNELSQSDLHTSTLNYIASVLGQLFKDAVVGIYQSPQLFGDPLYPTIPKSPDLIVIDGLRQGYDQDLYSYYIDADHLPPRIVLEAASDSTWAQDIQDGLDDKPQIYARMGVPEYFAFDPHVVPVWPRYWRKQGRLVGWQLDPTSRSRQYQRIQPDAQGRLWSEQLQSFLVMEGPGGNEFHLYDHEGHLRLTDLETERQQRKNAEDENVRLADENVRLKELLRRLQPNLNIEDM